MARARPIEGLDPHLPYASAAVRIVGVRAEELHEAADGVLDTQDIEPLHDMRVASRRLRAALEIFGPCFPPDEHKALLKDVKRLADALGERRDCDVTIAFLERFAAGVPGGDRVSIRGLIDEVRFEQAAANDALKPFLANGSVERLNERLASLARGRTA
jgi:CHAD domain-containing protein